MECHRYRTTNFLIPIINFHVTAEFQFNFFSSTILHSLKPSSSPLLLIDNADLDNFYRSSLNNQIRKKKGRESSQVKKQERINKNKKQLIFLDWILQMENCMHADWNSWLEIGGGGPFYTIFSATGGGGGKTVVNRTTEWRENLILHWMPRVVVQGVLWETSFYSLFH